MSLPFGCRRSQRAASAPQRPSATTAALKAPQSIGFRLIALRPRWPPSLPPPQGAIKPGSLFIYTFSRRTAEEPLPPRCKPRSPSRGRGRSAWRPPPAPTPGGSGDPSPGAARPRARPPLPAAPCPSPEGSAELRLPARAVPRRWGGGGGRRRPGPWRRCCPAPCPPCSGWGPRGPPGFGGEKCCVPGRVTTLVHFNLIKEVLVLLLLSGALRGSASRRVIK